MSAPTWWLVITSPSGETNEPEPPLLNRTAAERRCSTQPAGGSKPYRSLSAFSGRLSKTHIPSSASTVPPEFNAARTASAASVQRDDMVHPPGDKRRHRGAGAGRTARYDHRA